MREIKFRGKGIYKGKDVGWLYGDLVTHYNLDNEIYRFIRYYPPSHIEERRVYPETIGQYTGLKDMNGVEIYEGDVLQGKSKRMFSVQYNSKIAGFVACAVDDRQETPCMNYGTMQSYKIIGNIHDNPELLEEE